MKKAVIIGAGFSGLSAATFLAKYGWDVTIIEKHKIAGGRARQFTGEGFRFDMGPSWYWMPEVFERYFNSFGAKRSDFYSLKRLDPSYRVFWEKEQMDIPAGYPAVRELFEKSESGSGKKLDRFLKQAAYKYKVGIHKLAHKPGQSWGEFLDWEVIKGVFRLAIFSSVKKQVDRYFKNPHLRQLLEFPVLFLGALPADIPALYSLMNFADIEGGTWYPEKGMYSIVDAMTKIAVQNGVKFQFDENVTAISITSKVATGVKSESWSDEKKITRLYDADVVIATADYHFVETKLLPERLRTYSNRYWENRILAPGCLLYYIGLKKRLTNVAHHSLFFDVDFEEHAQEIYQTKKWPANPLFYVSATSVSDEHVAPEGCENLFFLIPVAAGLNGDDKSLREEYFDKILTRFENRVGEKIRDHIIYRKSFGPADFVHEYNAFKGNAYGLANTLMQTAVLKPSCRSKKVRNLFYAGQFTVPGPGVPPSLISGEIAAKEVMKHFGV